MNQERDDSSGLPAGFVSPSSSSDTEDGMLLTSDQRHSVPLLIPYTGQRTSLPRPDRRADRCPNNFAGNDQLQKATSLPPRRSIVRGTGWALPFEVIEVPGIPS
jgi:hypothetical protein